MHTILVVEDHADMRSLLSCALEGQGYSVLSACNGREALAVVLESSVSLILMDINMPELDGFETTAEIRSSQVTCRPPIIAVSAYALPGDKSRAMAAGCDGFHTKPIDFSALFQQISGLLERQPGDLPKELS